MNEKRDGKKIVASVLGISVITILIIVLAAWITPRTLAFYDQLRSGHIYHQALSLENEAPKSGFSCALPILHSQQSRVALLRANQYSDQALRMNPKLAQAVLGKGRVSCLIGRPDEAIQSFMDYSMLRPKNPLGYMELISGIEAYWKMDPSERSIKFDDLYLANIYIESLNKLGVTPAQVVANASQMFDLQKYQESEKSFWQAALLGNKLSESELFKWVISSILSGGSQSIFAPPDDNTSMVYLFEENGSLQIDGNELRWIGPDVTKFNFLAGTKLSEVKPQDPGVGVIWWAGTAGFLVQLPIDSDYKLTVRSEHIPESKNDLGEMELLYDTSSITHYELIDNWQELHTCISGERGVHFIGFEYIKDVGDVLIDWIQIEPSAECSLNP